MCPFDAAGVVRGATTSFGGALRMPSSVRGMRAGCEGVADTFTVAKATGLAGLGVCTMGVGATLIDATEGLG